MVRLQSNDVFLELAELDETTGAWTPARREPSEKGYENIDGSFSVLSGVFCALFLSNGEIFVRVGDTQVQLSDDVKITVDGPDERRCLTPMSGVKTLATIRYAVEEWRIPNDPTPFIDDEDFDFGLWISNIAGSPIRQRVMKAKGKGPE